jgi:hypothetical protein
MYAKVTSGVVIGVSHNIPHEYDNINGFERLPPSEQIARGIYPIDEVKPDLTFNEVDDGDKDADGNPVLRKVFTQAYGQTTDTILADKVVRTYSVVALPAQDVGAEKNRPTLKKIAHEESKQARSIREAVLGQPGAVARLQAIDDKIAALRARLA